MNSNRNGLEIAIIGMAGRFPGSKNINELWNNLREGKNLITYFTDEELLSAGVPEDFLKDKNYVKARGIISGAEEFDADFFNFYPKEAEMLDPQQRLFLECVWEALEDAGYCPDNIKNITGVFGGVGMNTYILQFLNSNKEIISSAEGYKLSLGNDKDFLTTRVSYKLNLKGPSVDIQTACSTSLVATHIACMNLLNYQCDIAIAGGATISFPQISGYHYQEGMILSPDGLCRPFDNQAQGTVSSNGVGVVVLKRLEDAINDKDEIYAVIKGSAYNNDGALKVGYAAPGTNGQKDVIATAFALADVTMDSIDYIETHGTGTTLGDPIEIDALTQAFRTQTNKNNFCAIGSVKSNLGHLDTAAGVTGLIKAALSIYHKKILPSINYDNPNNKINFAETPFYVNTNLVDWNRTGSPRRAAVSSFGIGGTNAHVVLEEAPELELSNSYKDWNLLVFSAKSKKVLDKIIFNFKNIERIKNANLNNIAFTLQTGRKNFNYRSISIVKDYNQLNEKIHSDTLIFAENFGRLSENPQVVFMFSGQGSQYINMTLELYETEEIFKKHLDECFDILLDQHNLNLKEVIFPVINNFEIASEKLKQTEFTQPALFIIEYSLAKMLIDLGIHPYYMIGHSIGEYVAATLSGVMDLKNALKLVVERGKLMQRLKAGKMLSVKLSESELRKIIPDSLDIAVINANNLTVVSGEENDILAFRDKLNNDSIVNILLHTSHAFHSRMMIPILDDFKNLVESVNLFPPQIPYLSNLTSTFITEENATDPNYYVNHLRYTVRFGENVSQLIEDNNLIFLEVGPGTSLVTLVKQNEKSKDKTILNTVRTFQQKNSDKEILLSAIGRLWLNGINIKWENLYNDKPKKVHLPTYPFDKKRFWFSPNLDSLNNKIAKTKNNWLYNLNWQRLNENYFENDSIVDQTILIFDNHDIPIEEIFTEFKNRNKIICVYPGEEFKEIDYNKFTVSPNSFSDYTNLFAILNNRGLKPNYIIHNWQTLVSFDNYSEQTFFQEQILSFNSLINIVNSLTNFPNNDIIHLGIITNNLFDVSGEEDIAINSSTIIGLSTVINQEYGNLQTKIVDLNLNTNKNYKHLKQNILCALFNLKLSRIAIRGNYLWKQIFDEIKIQSSPNHSFLNNNGVYIITGGLGRIGLLFAEHLSKLSNTTIILIDQIDLPEKSKWKEFIASAKDKNLERLKILDKINQKVSNLIYYQGDISQETFWTKIINDINQNYSKINGIIHSAGILGESAIQLIKDFQISNFEIQSKAKVFGTQNIFAVTQKINVDFVLINSSMATILGGIGFASYAAVNNFIDSFVLSKLKENHNSTKWICVNWEAWNFGGDLNINSANPGLDLTPSKGIEIFNKILEEETPSQIFVSSVDLNERISQDKKRRNESLKDNMTAENLHERPELSNEFISPKSDIEKQIAEEWSKVLGVEKIGLNDNFFELGGDSLIGTHLVSLLRTKFNCEIPLTYVFENATVKGIADLINKQLTTTSESKNIEDVLSFINQLSEEETNRMLKEKKTKLDG